MVGDKWRRYSSEIVAKKIDQYCELYTLTGIYMGLPGDYLCQDNEGNQWIEKKETFEARYCQLPTT